MGTSLRRAFGRAVVGRFDHMARHHAMRRLQGVPPLVLFVWEGYAHRVLPLSSLNAECNRPCGGQKMGPVSVPSPAPKAERAVSFCYTVFSHFWQSRGGTLTLRHRLTEVRTHARCCVRWVTAYICTQTKTQKQKGPA